MASKDVVLVDSWMSPYGQSVRIALEEKGVKYEYLQENFAVGKKSPLLLQSNPVHKKIPVLIHDGKPVCDSLVIIEYIDDVWSGSAPILPEDPYARAQARFWADFADKKIYEGKKKLWELKGEELEALKKEFIQNLKLLEDELGDKTFFGDETFGLVDIVLLPFFPWFFSHNGRANFANIDKEVRSAVPKLMAWYKRCKGRESILKALYDPKKVYEFVCLLQKRYGVE